MRKFSKKEMELNDLETYLADSDSEQADDDKKTAQEKRNLLLGGLSLSGAANSDDGESSSEDENLVADPWSATTDSGNIAEESEEEDFVGEKESEEEESAEEEDEIPGSSIGAMEMTFDLDTEKKTKDLAARARELQQAAVEKSTKKAGQAQKSTLAKEKKSAWGEYQERRREKKREKKQQIKEKRKEIKETVKKELERTGTKGKKEQEDSSSLANGPFGSELAMKKHQAALASEDSRPGKSDVSVPAIATKEELELLTMDANAEEDRDFDIKQYGRSKKKVRESSNPGGSFQPDVADPRLQKLFTDPKFSIDPTLPQFSKTLGMQSFLAEKRKRSRKKMTSKQDLAKTEDRTSCEKRSKGSDGIRLEEIPHSVAAGDEKCNKRMNTQNEDHESSGGITLFKRKKKKKQ